MIEDASVDHLLIDPCREVGPVPKVLHVGDVVVVEDQDLVPDLNEVTNNFHKLNGPRHKFLMKKNVRFEPNVQMLPLIAISNESAV